MRQRVHARKHLGSAALYIVACLALSDAHSAERPQGAIAGSYEILICNSSCPAMGEENVWVKGRLVLLPARLEQREVDRFEAVHGDRTRLEGVNGCFTLDKLQGSGYRGYAGITKTGLTAWSIEGNDLRFALFRSPDAGYEVTAQHTPKGFEGKGVSWGAGVASPIGVHADRITIRRIGDADMSQCE